MARIAPKSFGKKDKARAGGGSAGRASVGDSVRTKLQGKFGRLGILLLAACAGFASGCGSSHNTNVVMVSVTASGSTNVIVGTSVMLTGTVTGATNLNVTWACTYTTTTTTGTGSSAKTTTSAATACSSATPPGAVGAISDQQDTTVLFTAPTAVPSQTNFPLLVITITATSVADTKVTGTITLTLDSGISVALTPLTATVPTLEQEQFQVGITNDTLHMGVTWLVTQTSSTTTTPEYQLPTCSPGCGMIDAKSGLYTAPSTVPTSTTVTTTPADVTVVVYANADPSRFATGTITIIQGGPIVFNGISPTIAPQGALFWDIYLNAPNISSSSTITLTDAHNGMTTLTSNSNQVKVVFPIPNTTVTNPASTGARIRLLANNLAVAGPVTVSVTDPGETVTTSPTGVFTYNIIPTRATSISSVPDDVIQGTLGSQTKVSIDGGNFGPNGNSAKVTFQGNTIPQDPQLPSNARQLHLAFSTSGISSGGPGLYPLSVVGNTFPIPAVDNPSVTNLAVFPDYSSAQPVLGPAVPAGNNPSAIDIDTDLGVVVVAEAGSNAIQFYRIVAATGAGPGTLVPIDPHSGADCAGSCTLTSAPDVTTGNLVNMNLPVGVSVNRNLHTVAVINYGQQTDNSGNTAATISGQTVMVFPIPFPGGPANVVPGTPFSLDISNVLQGAVVPAPMPYAIGVDPDTNLALVAYSSTASNTASNLGFVINLNPPGSQYTCIMLASPAQGAAPTGQCVFAQVTLNTGAYPQIAFGPHSHVALVTPGGMGSVSGVDVTKKSTSTPISSITLGAGIVTVTTSAPHNLLPGNPGSVLIAGVPTMNSINNTNFNGVFSVAVDSDVTFSYSLPNNTAAGTYAIPANTMPVPTVYYNTPNFEFGVSQTAQGVAINPITRTAALADANATGGGGGAQIDLLNSLDQSVSSIAWSSGCTFFTNPCQNSIEFAGTTNVAWQPYTNAVVSYNPNPKVQEVSISDPTTRSRYAFLMLKGPGSLSMKVMNGTTGTLTLFGGIVVDPASNQAFVAESGSSTQSGQIEVVSLGLPGTNSIIAVKPLEITEVLVPSPTPGLGNVGGIPNALVPDATLTSATDLSGVLIYGSGFGSAGNATTQVRLDGAPIPQANVQVLSDRKMMVTIPAAFLSAPHHYSLDVLNGAVQSNSLEFLVIQAVDLSKVCAASNTMPSSVAIADQIANGPFSPIAVVTLTGCNNIAVIDVNPASLTFGSIINTAAVGAMPEGIAVSQRFGLAVVANNGDGTASVIDLTKHPPVQAVPAIQTGSNAMPIGVAINEATGAALIANSNANTVSEVDLSQLFAATPATTLTANNIGGIQNPIAVAIDPDRGTNNQGLAVVTALALISGSSPEGELASVDIGLTSPALSTTATTGNVTASPTGIVFDPTAASGTTNGGLFYANSSGGNVISTFNPDNGSTDPVDVGINPTALAYNPLTGALLTTNFGSQTISIVDMLSNPFKTRQTLGLPGSPQFGVAIDPFTNLAVIVDQGNKRAFIFPMPN